jgi:hypothetical protein
MNFESSEEAEVIRKKRVKVLLGTWKSLTEAKLIDPSQLRLSNPLLNEVLEHYIADRTVIRARYKIDAKIQLHKIAGLMTAAVLRYRPIQLTGEKYNSPNEMYANEIFAIYHGLAICADGSDEVSKEIVNSPAIDAWIKDFCYLLHHRNYTPESLIFIFETFCAFWLPDNLRKFEE